MLKTYSFQDIEIISYVEYLSRIFIMLIYLVYVNICLIRRIFVTYIYHVDLSGVCKHLFDTSNICHVYLSC